jgi:hypothetical protein
VAYSPGAKAGTAGLIIVTFPERPRHSRIPHQNVTSTSIVTTETLVSGSAVMLETAGKQIVERNTEQHSSLAARAGGM